MPWIAMAWEWLPGLSRFEHAYRPQYLSEWGK
jgi:hypothetical protein